MANMIANEWSIDLISLQEINTDITGMYRGEKYQRDSWQALQHALQSKGYQTKTGMSGDAQRVVIAWRKPVQIKTSPTDMDIPDHYEINESCRSANLRKPLAGLFRANAFDFWFVGLHLKSGFRSKNGCADNVREQQLVQLNKKVPDLRQQDKDIVLAGDFNASAGDESLKGLKTTGFISLTQRQFRHAGSNHYSQGKARSGNTLDHIMINPGMTSNEWLQQSTILYKPSDPVSFMNRFSDHLPVWTDFDTRRDDD